MDRVEEKFWSKVDKSGECWEWKAYRHPSGYGHFEATVGGVRTVFRAHRFSYQVAVGDIPEGLLVCHHCDNRACVRPDHLFLGTDADNIADMHSKGKVAGRPRVPEPAVLEIRRLADRGLSYGEIGRQFGISRTAARDLAQRRRQAAVA